ncbi:MAG: hypothetical protein H7Y15_09580 [Pseudonocardia sp.]|nr:hypothetical protein [Pseudonocardia sp.]
MATSNRTPAESAPKAVPSDADEQPKNAESSNAGSGGTEYLNVTNSLVIYDKEGHGIGGGEWTEPIHLDAIGKAARANGYLLPRSAL